MHLHNMKKRVEVAAGIIFREDGAFLLGRRQGSFYAGYWEFPGGKVEEGEDAAEALARELDEELGIRVGRLNPWVVRRHDYEHANVCLRFFEVNDWHGQINDLVHDALSWQRAGDLTVGPMLPANGPILKALELPRFMGITQAGMIGFETQLDYAESALQQGLRMIQLREPDLDIVQREAFARRLLVLARRYGALVVFNDDAELARRLGADGVQLKSRTLSMLRERPDFRWVGASCHDEAELAKAAALEVDYAVLGAVKQTATHPGVAGRGWSQFERIKREASMPVYALGGLGAADMTVARAAGAHGVAAIRQAWAG